MVEKALDVVESIILSGIESDPNRFTGLALFYSAGV